MVPPAEGAPHRWAGGGDAGWHCSSWSWRRGASRALPVLGTLTGTSPPRPVPPPPVLCHTPASLPLCLSSSSGCVSPARSDVPRDVDDPPPCSRATGSRPPPGDRRSTPRAVGTPQRSAPVLGAPGTQGPLVAPPRRCRTSASASPRPPIGGRLRCVRMVALRPPPRPRGTHPGDQPDQRPTSPLPPGEPHRIPPNPGRCHCRCCGSRSVRPPTSGAAWCPTGPRQSRTGGV